MRKLLLPSLIIIAASLLLIRIFYLQVVDDTFKLKSENNAIKIKYDYPKKYLIFPKEVISMTEMVNYWLLIKHPMISW